MDQMRFAANAYKIMHQHKDGSWGEMEEIRRTSHHSSVDHDPERSWLSRRFFRCTSCEEYLTVSGGEDAREAAKAADAEGHSADTADTEPRTAGA